MKYLVIKVFNCLLQGDDVPFHRNVPFDGCFFPASESWVPIVDTEPLLFGQAIGHIGIEAVFLISCRVFPDWCLPKGGIVTIHVDQVAFQDSGEIRVHPRTVSYGRDVFFVTREDLFVRVR